jgi:extradiol dioxygenase family protein
MDPMSAMFEIHTSHFGVTISANDRKNESQEIKKAPTLRYFTYSQIRGHGNVVEVEKKTTFFAYINEDVNF